jgi:pyruvate/2-oxoglutarate dehydrogenase complex dihydrolipoamide dehydrogenase (E3) component
MPAIALASAARRAEYIRTAGAFGIAGDEPRINARGVFDHVHQVIEASSLGADADQIRALGIELVAAEARFLDRRTLIAADRRIRARRFVLATGSRPLVPDIAGLADVAYFTTASIFDNPRKLTHLVVIGGGPAGIELAQAHRRLGADVTVLDVATPLGGFDPELSDIALRRLADEGVVVRPAIEILAVQGRSLGIGVVIRSGGTEETLDASHILVATGRAPMLDGLDIEKAGIRRRRDAPALQLGRRLKTTNPRVYAVGDVAGGGQHVHAARQQAEMVVRHALFGLPATIDPVAIPKALFTDPEIAEIGLTEPLARVRLKAGFEVLRASYAENDRARAGRDGMGLVKLVVNKSGKILGAGIVGAGAGELIALFALAIAQNLDARALATLPTAYPSLTELVAVLGRRAAESSAPAPAKPRRLPLNRLLR